MKFWPVILIPLSFLWNIIYGLRRYLYNIGFFPSYDLKRNVISVGNLSFGGTGKTPHVIYLSKLLEEEGQSSLILTRGYKSDLEEEGAIVNEDNLLKSGDEPRLLFENLNSSIVVGRKRYQNFKKYEENLRENVIILDDGFQHLKIRRNIDIILIDSTKETRGMHCAPAGELREHVSNLKFADYVILTKTNLISNEELRNWNQYLDKKIKVPVYNSKFIFDGLYSIGGKIESILNKKIVALSAIGNPLGFESSLNSEGFKITRHFIFKDHYDWNKEELQEVIDFARDQNTVILTTEKDFMKIKKIKIELDNIYFMKIKVELENEQLFQKELRKRLFND